MPLTAWLLPLFASAPTEHAAGGMLTFSGPRAGWLPDDVVTTDNIVSVLLLVNCWLVFDLPVIRWAAKLLVATATCSLQMCVFAGPLLWSTWTPVAVAVPEIGVAFAALVRLCAVPASVVRGSIVDLHPTEPLHYLLCFLVPMMAAVAVYKAGAAMLLQLQRTIDNRWIGYMCTCVATYCVLFVCLSDTNEVCAVWVSGIVARQAYIELRKHRPQTEVLSVLIMLLCVCQNIVFQCMLAKMEHDIGGRASRVLRAVYREVGELQLLKT